MATVFLLLAQSEIVGLSALLLGNAPQHADADQACREQGERSRDRDIERGWLAGAAIDQSGVAGSLAEDVEGEERRNITIYGLFGKVVERETSTGESERERTSKAVAPAVRCKVDAILEVTEAIVVDGRGPNSGMLRQVVCAETIYDGETGVLVGERQVRIRDVHVSGQIEGERV